MAHCEAEPSAAHREERRHGAAAPNERSIVYEPTLNQRQQTICCDTSPNRHASKHARATDHPVNASAQPGERWLYCYPYEEMAAY
jgi:hypothetical protein